jgi:hypothetical protein
LAVDTEEVLIGDILLITAMELLEEVEEEHLAIEAVSVLLELEEELEHLDKDSLVVVELLIILAAVVVLEVQAFQQHGNQMVGLD